MASSSPPFPSSSTRISSAPVRMPLPAAASRPSRQPFLLSSLCETKNPSSLRHSRPSSPWSHFRVSIDAPRTRPWISSPPNLCSKNEVSEVNDAGNMMAVSSDSDEIKSESKSTKSFSFNETMQKLKRYGVAGVLSYGLLNTIYYLITFLLVWFYFAPAPGKLGYAAAVERFLKLMAMVWAGSQVTKIVRAGGALALAPFVDRGLSWFTVKFKFRSRGKAFAAIAGLCFGLALLMFFGLTVLWA